LRVNEALHMEVSGRVEHVVIDGTPPPPTRASHNSYTAERRRWARFTPPRRG
jgi:hypothetical protein